MKGIALRLYVSPLVICVAFCAGLCADEPAKQPKETSIELRISRAFIRRILMPTVDETTPINRCFFGSHVTGTAHTVGQTSVGMEIMENDATFTFYFTGTTYQNQLSSHPPVYVTSSGRTDFQASRKIYFDGRRFVAGDAAINASQCSTINCVQTPRGLIGAIARRKAWQNISWQKPIGDEISLNETKSRVLASFDRQTELLVNELNRVVPYEKTIGFLAPKTKDWVAHLGTTREYLVISPGPRDARIAVLPKEGFSMRAPLELWVRGKPEGDGARQVVEEWSTVQRALDRFRGLITGTKPKIEGLSFTAVGEWWVIKVGEDLLDQWAEKMEQKAKEAR